MSDWQTALHHFEAMTGYTATLHRRTDDLPGSSLGTWWTATDDDAHRDFDCVQLSVTDFAAFEQRVDKPLQQALTWMLSAGDGDRENVPLTVSESLQQMLCASSQQLVAAFASPAAPDAAVVSLPPSAPDQTSSSSRHNGFAEIPVQWARKDGYLLWVLPELSTSSRRAQPNSSRSAQTLRSVAGDIIDAFVPRGWREWWDEGVLLWVDDDVLADYTDRDDESVQTEPGAKSQSALMRLFAADLLQVLEEDALITANAVVSQAWRGRRSNSNSMQALLASLVLAQKSQGTNLRRDRVSVFGEQTLVHAAQALTVDGRQMLVQMAGDLATTFEETDELSQTLEAMMEANLNVSEAARLLYVHRNTLIHRLLRIREATGRDLRRFDDAASLLMSLLAMRAH